MYVFVVIFINRLFIVWPYVTFSYISVLYMHVAIQQMTIIITSLSRILWSACLAPLIDYITTMNLRVQ